MKDLLRILKEMVGDKEITGTMFLEDYMQGLEDVVDAIFENTDTRPKTRKQAEQLLNYLFMLVNTLTPLEILVDDFVEKKLDMVRELITSDILYKYY